MRRALILCLLAAVAAFAPTARGGTKEEIMRLQNDVLALQNQLRLFEKTFNEKTDGLRSLVAQLNDQIGKSHQVLGNISARLESQTSGDRSNNEALLQEIRNLTLKVDDSGTRISALAQQIADLKVQSKPIAQRVYQSDDPAAIAASGDTVFNEAYNDLIQGNLDLAVEGFTAYVRNYPNSEKADDAQYNIGEAFYNSGKYPQAIGSFTRVLSEYASGDKVSSAYYKRAKAELEINERDNAIADFRTVVQKYPSSPEAALAKAELDKLGASAKPAAKPATRRKR